MADSEPDTLAAQKKSKKHLSFSALRQAMTGYLDAMPDPRQGAKCDYSVHDTVMSAFACMYFQDPSLKQFQERLEKKHQRSNLQTLFRVKHTPKDSQMRDILDQLDSELLAPIFKDYHERLRRHKYLEDYQALPGMLLCVMDGTQYHSSKSIHCPCCLHKEHQEGERTYSHAVLQGAVMHPDKRQVLPVMPEAISNHDGNSKQDCEINAAKRFIARLKQAHPRQSFILGGDSLMSRQPLIELALAHGMHVLFTAKRSDHKYLYEWLDAYDELPTLEQTNAKGITHRFRWQNKVPLNGRADALDVNYVEYQQLNSQGKVTYSGGWVTDIEVTKDTVVALAQAGRCRWKIENECFNSLKTQGYELTHNYGHGKRHLSYTMYLLTLLAFFYHQIFELTDGMYQACRKAFGSKRHLWENLRSTIRMLVVESWEMLLDLLLNEEEYEVTAIKKH